MATEIQEGFTTWSMQEDSEGHRDYNIEFKVRADVTDGPFNVRNTPGLPLPGAFWQFRGDVDPVAFCKRNCQIVPEQVKDEATVLWRAGFRYSTRPDKRCQDSTFSDPLMEPMKISGSFTKYREEATVDRYLVPLRSSSHERLKGPQIEFDAGLPTVKIEQNVLNLELNLLAIAIHTVNSVPMWGLPVRCVKLSGITWQQSFYGNCFPYYTRSFEYEINPDGFDRDVADEGTKVLMGRWERPGVYRLLCVNGDVPDKNNPSHFTDFKFPNGNPGRVVLNGAGLPAGACILWDGCPDVPGGLRGKLLGCPEDAETSVSTLTTSGQSTAYYLSLWNNNKGSSLDDGSAWVNIYNSVTPSDWVSAFIYVRGRLVNHNNKTWVAIQNSRGDEPTTTSSNWLLLGNTVSTGTGADHTLDDRGVYNPCTNYMLGDYVVENANSGYVTGTGSDVDYTTCDKTKPGLIHIEKYSEINFFQFNMPTVL